MGLLDFLFPKICSGCGHLGTYFCDNCVLKTQWLEQQFCPECSKPAIYGKTHPSCIKSLGLDGLDSIAYYSFPINKLIQSVKYKFTFSMVREVVEKLPLKEDKFPSEAKIIALPLHQSRQNLRGFNQAELFATIYAKKLKREFFPGVLVKVKNTKPQVGLKRIERLKNLKDTFEVRKEVRDQSFILVDDVWTTGSTLKTAAFILKRAGAKEVWGLTLARSH